MTTNSRLRRFLLAFLILTGFAPLLQAQSAGNFGDTESGEPRFIQRLLWTGGEYALRYEVVVQREVSERSAENGNSAENGSFAENRTYITQLQESTEASFVEVSLPPGRYRFQVTSYNVLDKPEEVSQWVSFDINAVDPNDIPDTLRPILMIAGAAWAPVFPLHGDFFGDSFSLAGAGAHFGVAFPVPRDLYLGAQATAFWYVNNANLNNPNADTADTVDIDDFGHFLSAGINLLAMKWLQNQTMALNIRLGVSFIILPDTQDKLVFNIGASYLWRFTGNFTLEAGFDYASRLEDNLFDGCIRPWIGVGMFLSPYSKK